MNKIALGGIATALALAFAPAASAATFDIDQNVANAAQGGFFFTTSALPGFSSVTAAFGHTVGAPGFDDTFRFRLPVSGTGSGSITTTFVSSLAQITITDVIITNTIGQTFSFLGGDITVNTTGTTQQFSAALIPIVGDLVNYNTIRVIGTVNGTNTYTGTVSFAAAVPEATTWALMILGIGAVGFAARRARKTAVRVTYA